VILIALGANLHSAVGEPAVTLTRALAAIHAQRIRVLRVSAFYATPAWPDPADPPFVNAVAAIDTDLTPLALLTALHGIEIQFGRKRLQPNAPRTLDLDLLDYDGRVENDALILPHPRIAERAFVLVPLADVAPDWKHPVTGMCLKDLLTALPENERQAVVPLSV